MGSIMYAKKNWYIDKIIGIHKYTKEEVVNVIIGEDDTCGFYAEIMSISNYYKAISDKPYKTIADEWQEIKKQIKGE